MPIERSDVQDYKMAFMSSINFMDPKSIDEVITFTVENSIYSIYSSASEMFAEINALMFKGGAEYFIEYQSKYRSLPEFPDLLDTAVTTLAPDLALARHAFRELENPIKPEDPIFTDLADLKKVFDVGQIDEASIQKAKLFLQIGRDQIQREIEALKKALTEDPSKAAEINTAIKNKLIRFRHIVKAILPAELRKKAIEGLSENGQQMDFLSMEA